jgi:DTW domain-containing protein YfiP
MPRVSLTTRVVLVQNNHERTKPTNTGRLAALMLDNSELCFYAVRGESFDPTPLQRPELDYALVFHRESATPILSRTNPAPVPGKTRTLVFLDGTWAQCSRMSRRVTAVQDMPAYALPPGPPSPWAVRGETHPDRLSTLEAVLRALELVEDTDAVETMRDWFDLVTAGQLYMKNKLPSPSVPDEWRALRRRGRV